MIRAAVRTVLSLLTFAAVSGCLSPFSADAGHADDGHDDVARASDSLGAPDLTLEAHAGMPGADLTFHPGPIEVPAGSVVELLVENRGDTPHTFTIHDLGVDTGNLDPGERATLKFRADAAGSYEIMCDTAGHYEAGMRTTLDVVPA